MDSRTATSTLADALLEDLDDLSDGNEESSTEENIEVGNELETETENEESKELAAKRNLSNDNIHTFLTITSDEKLQSHLTSIKDFQTNHSNKLLISSIDQKKEYELIVESNTFLTKLSNEYTKSYQSLCHAYNSKFPELEDLLKDPIQYKNAVFRIGNEMDMTKLNESLNEILNSNQIITISVAGSTTNGTPLSESQLQNVYEIITHMDTLEKVQSKLSQFVESRMDNLSPNVCALVGPTIAARLLGHAGGLAELSKIPACNLQVIGHIKESASSRAGMSAFSLKGHAGLLLECDLVQSCPRHLAKKAVKTVAAKLALAARCDYVNVERGAKRSNDAGRKFREEIKNKIQKWEEPDKAPVIKALPKPDLTTKKRRGGKRIRHLKERFAETDLMKQANTRAFNTQAGEYADDAMGVTLGLLDSSKDASTNQVRFTREVKKMRIANTKASRKKALKMNVSHNATEGLASSMAFTPVQGLELVNPDLQKKRIQDANKKWFKEDTGFLSALPK